MARRIRLLTWHNARRPFRSLTLCPSSLVSGGKFSLSTRCSEYMSAMYKRKVNLKSITSMKERLLIADAKDTTGPP